MSGKSALTLVISLLLAPTLFVFAQTGDTPPAENPSSTSSESVVESAPAETAGSAIEETVSEGTYTPAEDTGISSDETVRPTITTDADATETPAVLVSSSSASTSPLSSGEGFNTNFWVIVGSVAALLIGGFITSKFVQKKKKGSDVGNDRCGSIKALLEQKKAELSTAERGFSAQKAVVEALKKKAEEKKEDIKEKAKDKIKGTLMKGNEESALVKAVSRVEEVREIYEDVREKYEKAKKLLNVLKTSRESLQNEVKRLETSYAVCMSGKEEIQVSTKESGVELPAMTLKDSEKLFVDKETLIDAPAARVWEVLTRREYSDIWAREFSSGGPTFHIESNWKLGSLVLWKGKSGRVVVEGNVTALRTNSLLRFTVFDVREEERPPVGREDGITYELSERDGKTNLRVLQGDFSVMEEGEKYHKLSEEVWEKVLPIVKKLAESKQEKAP